MDALERKRFVSRVVLRWLVVAAMCVRLYASEDRLPVTVAGDNAIHNPGFEQDSSETIPGWTTSSSFAWRTTPSR
jgi:hypothetical protein